MKTYFKTLLRMFKKHKARFISIIFMVLVSVGFVSGIGSSAEIINHSITKYYQDQNVSDLILKSTSSTGFSSDDIAKVEELYGKENVNVGMSIQH